MATASSLFPQLPDPEAKVREIKGWLKSKGVRDFEPVEIGMEVLGAVGVVPFCLGFDFFFLADDG